MRELHYNRNLLSVLFECRKARSHKGDYGRAFMLCGSYSREGLSMSGAAILSARAAYRTGSGIVEVCTPRENYVPVSVCVPEAIFSLYDTEKPDIDALLHNMSACDTLLVGCGFGRGGGSQSILEAVLSSFGGNVVLDADALNILSGKPELWAHVPRGRTIITPHPGEMASLCGCSVTDILSDVPVFAQKFAAEHGVVCVLKDHNTVISDGGDVIFINRSGNAGMATAGSGDVLSGIICSIVSQKRNSGTDLCSLAAAGVYLHGLAGDAARSRVGEYSLMASDIVESIPEILSNF